MVGLRFALGATRRPGGWRVRCGAATLSSLVAASSCTSDTVANDEGEAATTASSEASTTTSEATSEASTSEESTGPAYCGGVEFFARPIPLRLVWVVDNSASTLTPYDHDGDPSTPDLSPADRIEAFTQWFFAKYPGDDGCHPLAPGLVYAPAPGAAAPPDAASCTVDAAQVVPDADSQPTFDAAWAARPSPSGSVALADAYAMATNSFMGVPSWEQPVIAVLAGSPPACGAGDSEMIDDRLFQRMNDAWDQQGIQTVVLLAGPQSGGTPTAVDGVPDGVDLALYWGSLQSVFGSWHFDVDERNAIEQLFDAASPTYGDCTYDLTLDGREPPSSPDLVDIVAVDGTPWPKLELSEDQCIALTGEGGWIWNNAPNRIRLCGDACAATQCEAQNPWPDNAVEVEVPYLCE